MTDQLGSTFAQRSICLATEPQTHAPGSEGTSPSIFRVSATHSANIGEGAYAPSRDLREGAAVTVSAS